MIDILTKKIKNSSRIKEQQNTAFTLSLLNYNQKQLVTLLEQYDCYKEKLSDEHVRLSFLDIVNKAKNLYMKNSKDDGIKELLEEMKRKFDITENQQISLASQNKQDAEKFKHLKKRSKQ